MNDLHRLPVQDGFRLRGLEMTRLETFTDAAFAFALTLLVISLEPPRDVASVLEALRAVPAFVASAVLLMMFWWAHHQWSRRFGLDDGPTVVLSCLLVFTVLVYVVPLRFMFGVFFLWIGYLTGLPIGPADVEVGGPAEVNLMFAIYGVGFAAMSLAVVLLNVHAWRRREDLALSPSEAYDTLTEAGLWSLTALVGLASATVAVLVPATWVGLPGWAYMILPVATPAFSKWRDRGRPVDRVIAPT